MNHHTLADDADVHESARIQVDYLSHKWQEADVWHTWRNMTRQKNEVANGVRLENASWRTWWQKRGKLKTVNPQTLNWLKDSDVTWLYGPLHEAPSAPPVPPKGASLEDKLNIIPPLPKGRKPILKKRTLAEVLVLGLAKTNNLPITPTRAHPDDIKELDIDSGRTKGPEERDRIMLLHTKSDTNLLRPSIGRVQQYPSPPLDEEVSTPRRSSMRTMGRSHLSSNSNDVSVSPPPTEEGAGRKRVGFNAYVAQCIAIAPGERDSSEDERDDDGDALSMRSAGSGGMRLHRPSLSSRSNSHSSARSEPLIIAPMAPTLLKENLRDDERNDTPALVYQPFETPFNGNKSDDELDFDEPSVPLIREPKAPGAVDVDDGATDLGGDYIVASKKRKLSTGETSPSNRPRKSLDGEASTSSPAASTTANPTIATGTQDPTPGGIIEEDSRGRTLVRTSSGSSLNERSRSQNGSSPVGSRSPESSRAASSSNAHGSSTEVGLTTRMEQAVSDGHNTGTEPTAQDFTIKNLDERMEGPLGEAAKPSEGASPKQESPTSGFVDKAAATARGLIGTLLNGPSASSNKRGSL